MRSSIGKCNCKALDALAGEFRGCGKESNARYIIGKCNCKALDALAAGEFRGCGKESNARYIFWGMQLQSARRIGRRVQRLRKGK